MAADRADAADGVVIGIGASAGGVEALTALIRALPADLPAAVLVVLHVPASGNSVLPQILDRAGALPARVARDGAPLEHGVVQIAPPNRHLTIEDGTLRLLAGSRENGHRPAIDPLFASIAAYGHQAIGVILSGTRDDGTRGMLAIKAAGGRVLVQDPREALFDGMIRNVQRYVDVDAALPVDQLAAELSRLAKATINQMQDDAPHNQPDDRRTATRYTCPDCGGALWRHEDGTAVSFRCSVGHAYSPDSLDGEQGRDVESALWAAVRLLGDRRTLLDELAGRATSQGHTRSAQAFRQQAGEVDAAASTIRRVIEGGGLSLYRVVPGVPQRP